MQQEHPGLILDIKAAFDPARSGPLPAAYEIHVDDTYALEIAAGPIEVRRATVGEPAATVTTDSDILRAVFTGRRTVATPVARATCAWRTTFQR
ncbi:hypothetical protein [Pseudonocardia sp. H11422]|uniref:hypothetical protein n=1 Tax=Pseudonocardia sp. H11422 TaxID=2835866 RepID=UPI001BDD17AF|nr:hypothetical protein [Pseudonocardia sp. H11422]